MKRFGTSCRILLCFIVLTGFVYPFGITGLAQFLFPEKANGSLITVEHQIIGSSLIGQQFDSVIYFFSRPSVLSYDPLPSGGSNYAMTNAELYRQVKERQKRFIRLNEMDSLSQVPAELLFSSASGLDPHISPDAAYLQVDRVAKARKLDDTQLQQLKELIQNLTEPPQFLCFGEKRINVLLLNLETDKIR
jgi:potassium-transporting ATPase KdpC subunit